MKRPALLLVALVVGALAIAGTSLVGCSDDSIKAGEARLDVKGEALVVETGGDRHSVTGTRTVHDGDRVTMVTGTAQLRLPDDANLELRVGHDRGANFVRPAPSSVVVNAQPTVEKGEVLVQTTRPLSIKDAGNVIHIDDGAAKISRVNGALVNSYAGGASIDSAGQVRSLRGLRKIEITVLGSPPTKTPPLDYDPTDPWDRRFLGDAMDLGERFERYAFILTSDLGARRTLTAATLRAAIPPLDDELQFGDDLVGERSADGVGDTIIGAAIAAVGRQGDFRHRWHSTFGFRDEGAAWGLVLLDQGVSRTPATRQVQAVVGSGGELAAPRTTAPTSTSGTTPFTPTTQPSGPTTTTPPTTPTTEPPVGGGVLPPAVQPIVDEAFNLLRGLLGGGR